MFPRRQICFHAHVEHQTQGKETPAKEENTNTKVESSNAPGVDNAEGI